MNLYQRGDFGMPVEVMVRAGGKLNIRGLVFYSYGREDNRGTRITGNNYWVDANGRVHFTTTLAGDIIITDRVLERR